MRGQFLTDTGQVRGHNEDAGGIFYNAAGQFMAVIADGMGGHQAGDVASQMALKLIGEKWQESNELSSPEETKEWLVQAITDVNETVYQHAQNNEECHGMGTTIVIAVCIDDVATIAHIGDSRCYMFNEAGFQQITEDHTLVNALVQSGQISKKDAQEHPRKNVVLKALGTEDQVTADVISIGFEQGDKLLLCSDGLTDKMEDEEIAERLKQDGDLHDAAEQLINLANERGGEDNISLIIIEHAPYGEEGEREC